MKLADPEQMRKIDSYAINNLGIPGIVLMENAALRVAEEACAMLKLCSTKGNIKNTRVLLAAGKGNNGGDAFAVARHLYCAGASVCIFMLAKKTDISGDALTNFNILENMGISVIEICDASKLKMLEEETAEAKLIIDGIFGTGLKGEVAGIARDVIESINASGKPILSIDIPSGICGETGKVLGIAIKATKTVTLCLPKTGLLVHPGCEYVGRLVTVDICIPGMAVESLALNKHVIDAGMISEIMPKRSIDSSKGDYGKVMVLTGSRGMTGSGCLCARAALRMGAGLVYLGVPSSLAPIYGAALTEPIVIPLDDDGTGHLGRSSISRLHDSIKKMDVVAAGPGLSNDEEITEVIRFLIKECRVPMVLDADALNAISRDVSVLKELKAEAVITPHPGEMARLTGLSIEEIQKDRIRTARDFAQKWGVTTVLKGSRTIVALPDGSVYINNTGNPGMASGGSGDVLTGMIAGLIGQGVKPAEAAMAGVYMHGLAGDAAAERLGLHSMLAGDIIESLPLVIKKMASGG